MRDQRGPKSIRKIDPEAAGAAEAARAAFDAAANDTEFGLVAAVFTENLGLAMQLANQIDAGMVHINGSSQAPGVPFGGYKQSGNGREGGELGMEEFLEVKAVSGLAAASMAGFPPLLGFIAKEKGLAAARVRDRPDESAIEAQPPRSRIHLGDRGG